MRANWIECTSTTGGTGPLTLSAVSGSPLPTNVYGSSGTRRLEYVVMEFTDSTRQTIARAESGVAPVDLSTLALSRGPVSTWDGTAYLPRVGSASAPTALSFGTTAANIRIMCAPLAEAGGLASVYTGTLYDNPYVGMLPAGMVGASGAVANLNLVHQRLEFYWFPALRMRSPISVISARIGAAYTGGSSSLLLGIYEVGANGQPGIQLADFGNLGALTATGNLSSAALSNPVAPPPADFFVAVLAQFTGGTGTPALMSNTNFFSGGPMGAAFGGSVGSRMPVGWAVTGQTALPADGTGMSFATLTSQPPFFAFR